MQQACSNLSFPNKRLKKMQEVAGLSGPWQQFEGMAKNHILALIDLVSKGATELSSHAVCSTWGCQAPVASFTRRPCSDHLIVVGCICNWRCSLAFWGARSLAFCGVRSLAFCAVCNLALCTCAKAKPCLKIQDSAVASRMVMAKVKVHCAPGQWMQIPVASPGRSTQKSPQAPLPPAHVPALCAPAWVALGAPACN